ncbi:hypothetical protein IWW38_000619 [Coemansia aciculifera]|uniref:Uncharacterized protein n=1 Tax=Coemansia aciculifera TaxID=417176 RepID=A0ACC1M8A8_9FUNG|nr:hypothetical protein IWW38_000619 [Coemansia aciculifera]
MLPCASDTLSLVDADCLSTVRQVRVNWQTTVGDVSRCLELVHPSGKVRTAVKVFAGHPDLEDYENALDDDEGILWSSTDGVFYYRTVVTLKMIDDLVLFVNETKMYERAW